MSVHERNSFVEESSNREERLCRKQEMIIF